MDPFDEKQIGARLKAFRSHLGLTQTETARLIGISPERWNNWERGERRISLGIARQLHERYGLSLDFIYLGRLEALPQTLIKALSPNPDARASSTENDNPESSAA